MYFQPVENVQWFKQDILLFFLLCRATTPGFHGAAVASSRILDDSPEEARPLFGSFLVYSFHSQHKTHTMFNLVTKIVLNLLLWC